MYIVRYMFRNRILRLHSRVPVKQTAQPYLSDDIPTQMKILNTVIP